jgi:hypothetical protein
VVWKELSGKLIPLPVIPKFIPVSSTVITTIPAVAPTGIRFTSSLVPCADVLKFSDAMNLILLREL